MGSTILPKGAPALPGRAPSEPPSAPPEPLVLPWSLASFLSSLPAPPQSRSGLQNEPRNLQNRPKRVSKRVTNRGGLALLMVLSGLAAEIVQKKITSIPPQGCSVSLSLDALVWQSTWRCCNRSKRNCEHSPPPKAALCPYLGMLFW